jgi:hypothetical protein
MKRRRFLQQTGSMLAALGLSEMGLWLFADRARSALAQPARRKLALLVGIDRYPQEPHPPNSPISSGFPLTGCVTDVQLQRELLIHRFGFQPGDILTLTDEQATRSQIETAWITHLRDQAQADDLVVFHFSGYGSRIRLSDPANSWQNTLVPVDGGASAQEPGTVNDLLEDTLWLMLRSLPTDRFLTVLDTSYVSPARSLPGNFRIRARPASTLGQLTRSALAFPETLQRDVTFFNRFADRRQVPGIVLSAAIPEEWAMEAQWQGFSAGLLTYALTQNLWQTTGQISIPDTWQQVACQIQQWVGNAQHPQFCPGMAPPCPVDAANSDNTLFPVWLDPIAVGADGAILAIDPTDRTARLWLAGLPAEIVESYSLNSLFSTAPPETTNAPPSILLQVRTREGLTVKAQILASSDFSSLQAGQLVWEAVRVIPRHPHLTVALDETLERIERVDATSAFAALRYVSPVTIGEQPADFLFGRVQLSKPSAESQSGITPPSVRTATTQEYGSRYGLLSPMREIIAGSLTKTEEAVKTAIGRLSPQLDQLRALKLLGSIANEGSSRLGIQATLTVLEPTERVFLKKQTPRGTDNRSGSFLRDQEKPKIAPNGWNGVLTLPAVSPIRYQIKNFGDRPIYFLMFSFDPDGQSLIYYPLTPDLELHHRPISTDDIAIVPPLSDSQPWQTGRSIGRVTTHIVCSTCPFTTTLAALEAAHVPKSNALEKIANPLNIVSAMIEDLHQASLPTTQNLGLSKEVFALDANNWATLSFIYEVIRD